MQYQYCNLSLIWAYKKALVTYITRKYVDSQNKTFRLSNVWSKFVCKQLIMDRTTQHTTHCTFCECDTLHSLQNFVSFIVSHLYWFCIFYFWFCGIVCIAANRFINLHSNGRRFLCIEVHRYCSSWQQCWTDWRLKASSSEGLYCYLESRVSKYEIWRGSWFQTTDIYVSKLCILVTINWMLCVTLLWRKLCRKKLHAVLLNVGWNRQCFRRVWLQSNAGGSGASKVEH